MRDENPVVGRDGADLYSALDEEVADVYVTLREVRKANDLVNNDKVAEIIDQKRKRMSKRLGMKAESFVF